MFAPVNQQATPEPMFRMYCVFHRGGADSEFTVTLSKWKVHAVRSRLLPQGYSKDWHWSSAVRNLLGLRRGERGPPAIACLQVLTESRLLRSFPHLKFVPILL